MRGKEQKTFTAPKGICRALFKAVDFPILRIEAAKRQIGFRGNFGIIPTPVWVEIAEESRTLSVFAGKNPPQRRQNFLQYPHIASNFFLL